jgi:hypothetical protein
MLLTIQDTILLLQLIYLQDTVPLLPYAIGIE